MSSSAESDFSSGFEAHWRDQIVFIARHSTAEQRLDWLEEMLDLFKEQFGGVKNV